MRYLIVLVLLLVTNIVIAQDKFQLAPPMVKYQSAFYTGTTSFEVVFSQPGTAVHYTLNGMEPTAADPVYTKPVKINRNSKVKVKAFGSDYLPSETVSVQFVQEGKKIKSAVFSKPAEYYAKAKPGTLHDNVGGKDNYRSGDWIGYDSDTVSVDIELVKKESINSVIVDVLQDEPSWIFLPEQILAYYFDEKSNAYVPFAKEVMFSEAASPKSVQLRVLQAKTNIRSNKIRLEFHVVKKIPDWHSGKGKHAWLFIDEVIVY